MYEKHNWVNGEVITEDKLNHLEDGVATGGGIYTYGEVSLFDEEVTTAKQSESSTFASTNLQAELPKSDIHATFNSQNYTLPYGYLEGLGDYWGELDSNNTLSFTNYPLFIGEDEKAYMVATPEAGTYSLKVTASGITVNDSFKSALGGIFTVTLDANNGTLNKTFKEIMDANKTGLVIIKASEEELGDQTEVVLDVNADALDLISFGYISADDKADIMRYSAVDLNRYPTKNLG